MGGTSHDSSVIESWGRGIKKICDGFKAEGLPVPIFKEDCGGILVIIPRRDMTNVAKDDVKDMTERQRIIFNLIKSNGAISAEELAAKTNKVARTIQRNLSCLQSLGIIVHVGSRKEGHWELVTRK